jgi:hypothetical protein
VYGFAPEFQISHFLVVSNCELTICPALPQADIKGEEQPTMTSVVASYVTAKIAAIDVNGQQLAI